MQTWSPTWCCASSRRHLCKTSSSLWCCCGETETHQFGIKTTCSVKTHRRVDSNEKICRVKIQARLGYLYYTMVQKHVKYRGAYCSHLLKTAFKTQKNTNFILNMSFLSVFLRTDDGCSFRQTTVFTLQIKNLFQRAWRVWKLATALSLYVEPQFIK